MEAFWKILLAIIGILVFIVILIMLIGAWPFFSKKKKEEQQPANRFLPLLPDDFEAVDTNKNAPRK